MLARANQTAVDHRIRGDNCSLDPWLREIFIQPCPEFIRMPPVLSIPEQLHRRHNDLVTDVLHHIRRLLVRDRAAVMRDENNLFCDRRLLRRTRELRHEKYGQHRKT